MSQSSRERTLKQKASGNPPLVWSILSLRVAQNEASFLTDAQYWHVADQVMELARCKNPAKCETVDIKPIEEFYELREKGGPLGQINLRLYFYIDCEDGSIVILSVYKKEDEGRVRKSVVGRVKRRLRIYLTGE